MNAFAFDETERSQSVEASVQAPCLRLNADFGRNLMEIDGIVPKTNGESAPVNVNEEICGRRPCTEDSSIIKEANNNLDNFEVREDIYYSEDDVILDGDSSESCSGNKESLDFGCFDSGNEESNGTEYDFWVDGKFVKTFNEKENSDPDDVNADVGENKKCEDKCQSVTNLEEDQPDEQSCDYLNFIKTTEEEQCESQLKNLEENPKITGIIQPCRSIKECEVVSIASSNESCESYLYLGDCSIKPKYAWSVPFYSDDVRNKVYDKWICDLEVWERKRLMWLDEIAEEEGFDSGHYEDRTFLKRVVSNVCGKCTLSLCHCSALPRKISPVSTAGEGNTMNEEVEISGENLSTTFATSSNVKKEVKGLFDNELHPAELDVTCALELDPEHAFWEEWYRCKRLKGHKELSEKGQPNLYLHLLEGNDDVSEVSTLKKSGEDLNADLESVNFQGEAEQELSVSTSYDLSVYQYTDRHLWRKYYNLFTPKE